MSTKNRLFSRASALAAMFGAAALFGPASSHATILINEVVTNPVGTDDAREFVELISTTGGVESLSNLAILLIDSTGSTRGVIEDAWNLSSFSTGANGLLVLNATNASGAYTWGAGTPVVRPIGSGSFSGMDAGDINNNDLTVLLVSGFTGVGGASGTDTDTNDDGVFNASVPWTSVIDSVGWLQWDGPDVTYAGANLSQATFTPDAASRRTDNMTANSAAAWYGGDLNAAGGFNTSYDATQSFGIPPGAIMTPGSGNYPQVPEPSSVLLGLFGSLGLVGLAKRRKTR